LRQEARSLHAAGVPFSEIRRRLDLSRNTIAFWLYNRGRETTNATQRCPRCDRPARRFDDPRSYAYLLGQYLGDGHLLMTNASPS
jgi:hypothetical protein